LFITVFKSAITVFSKVRKLHEGCNFFLIQLDSYLTTIVRVVNSTSAVLPLRIAFIYRRNTWP